MSRLHICADIVLLLCFSLTHRGYVVSHFATDGFALLRADAINKKPTSVTITSSEPANLRGASRAAAEAQGGIDGGDAPDAEEGEGGEGAPKRSKGRGGGKGGKGKRGKGKGKRARAEEDPDQE